VGQCQVITLKASAEDAKYHEWISPRLNQLLLLEERLLKVNASSSSFILHPFSFAQMRLSILIQYHATEWTLSQARNCHQFQPES
jgi:hypothetical protein